MDAESVDRLRRFHSHVAEHLPDGLPGMQNAIPVQVAGERLQAVLLGLFDGAVEVGLFIDGTRYSRKTLKITADGAVGEDTVGVIPAFDLTDREPTFGGLANEDVALAVVGQLALEGRAGDAP